VSKTRLFLRKQSADDCFEVRTHGSAGHGAAWQMQLHPYYRQRKTEKVTTPQGRRTTIIRPSAPSLQHLHLWPAITVSRKYACADDLAIIHADGNWLAVEGVLSKDMANISEYIQAWKLKLSTTKTVSAVITSKTRKLNMSLSQPADLRR